MSAVLRRIRVRARAPTIGIEFGMSPSPVHIPRRCSPATKSCALFSPRSTSHLRSPRAPRTTAHQPAVSVVFGRDSRYADWYTSATYRFAMGFVSRAPIALLRSLSANLAGLQPQPEPVVPQSPSSDGSSSVNEDRAPAVRPVANGVRRHRSSPMQRRPFFRHRRKGSACGLRFGVEVILVGIETAP